MSLARDVEQLGWPGGIDYPNLIGFENITCAHY